MVEGLIGRKVGMTQTFDDAGNAIPVTVIKAGPCTVVQKKTEEKEGYSVLQLSFIEEKGKKRPPKPLVGHYTKSGIPPAKMLREFRFRTQAEVKEGDQFFVDIFQVGERVRVVGTSKGKGFAGVIKRWGFHGGKASHGSMFHRKPGSIGASAFPSRVVKGKKLPGQMGDQRVTVKNLIVVEADRDNNLLVVKGAVPGARGGYVLIKKEDFRPEEPEPERAKLGSNWLLGEVKRIENDHNIDTVDFSEKVSPEKLVELTSLVVRGSVSGTAAKTVLEEMFNTGKSAEEIISREGLKQISDTQEIENTIIEVLKSNVQAVADYKAGKTSALTFLVGQVMKATRGRANPKLVNELLKKKL